VAQGGSDAFIGMVGLGVVEPGQMAMLTGRRMYCQCYCLPAAAAAAPVLRVCMPVMYHNANQPWVRVGGV
jgi:hypothetical protein